MLVHEMFTAQARRRPNSIALVSATRTYTYAELDVLTNVAARRLRRAGARAETVVGCWSRDSVQTVIQLLSVLKAGAAYLLLDPHLPVERLNYMIGDAAPVCLLADEPPPGGISRHTEVLLTDEVLANAPSSHGAAPCPGVGPANLAYVAYTSGSTGRPKGVLILHAGLANLATAMRRQFDLHPGDRLPLMAPIAFDVATEEILPPLISGATLFDVPDRSPSMKRFTDDISATGYTILNIPAPLWHRWTTYLLDAGAAIPPTLRLVIVGSDKIHTRILQEWKSLRGAENVWWVAAYGVTEATVTSLLYLTADQDVLSDELLVPIGGPIDNVAAYVVREDGALAAPGEVGELYLGGAGLARGYHRLPAKTAQLFGHDHFASPGDARCYRTGDLVRRRSDGNLVWLGRRDSQIKINGLRIEPAEIEAMIQEYPAVGEAVLVHHPPAVPGETGCLVAYVAPRAAARIHSPDLHAYLVARLHPLMIPDEIAVLDAMPLNANGKIDRRVLESKHAQSA